MYPQRSVMTCGLATALEPPHFNPRTRVGCDLTSITCGCLRDGGFNPRTRVGCDLRRLGLHHDAIIVSIHAPAWGATPAPDLRIRGRVVSIHAPAWGATGRGIDWIQRKGGFNPRTRVGCDKQITGLAEAFKDVSIHAPAWGATHAQAAQQPATQCFNPRTRVGCDQLASGAMLSRAVFQSTHPRGVRPGSEGRRPSLGRVSIHAPAWGATWRHPYHQGRQ